MPKPARLPLLLLVVLSLVELAAEALHAREVVFVTKSTLLPLLAATYLAAAPRPRTRTDRRMTLAFVASWVGDVALMLAPETAADVAVLGIPKHDAWFLVGVSAFFVCHLSLIGVFRDVDRPDVPGPFPRRWSWFVPIAAYGLAIGAFLLPRLLADPERAMAAGPVAVYAVVLCTMVGMALQRHGRVSTASFVPTLVGAVTFLISDSMIGLAFLARVPLPEPQLLIMATYLAAEVLMAWGVLVQRRAPLL